MVEITRKIGFDMGHRVPNHESKCKNVHGHRYTAFITVAGQTVVTSDDSAEGMVVDFGDLKAISKDFIDKYLDHGYIGHRTMDNEVVSLLMKMGSKVLVVDFVPTAENIAEWLFAHLDRKFEEAFKDKKGYEFKLKSIKLCETPNCSVDVTSAGYQEKKYDKADWFYESTQEELTL